jgi:hypothetical protein
MDDVAGGSVPQASVDLTKSMPRRQPPGCLESMQICATPNVQDLWRQKMWSAAGIFGGAPVSRHMQQPEPGRYK